MHNGGSQFEYDRSKEALESLKIKILDWLLATYKDDIKAKNNFRIMEETVIKIVKRVPHKINWNQAGDPDWHGKYYHYISRWIKLENELGILTAQMFSDDFDFNS